MQRQTPQPTVELVPATIDVTSETKGPLPWLLIAEDNADDLFFLRRLLAKADVKNPIMTFGDGRKAMEYLQEIAQQLPSPAELPCILFLDIRLPVVQGFEVLSFARKLPVFDALRIVMLSSSDHPADRKRAMELGANDYVVKHPTAEILGAIVRRT